jgi:hypothetical protein
MTEKIEYEENENENDNITNKVQESIENVNLNQKFLRLNTNGSPQNETLKINLEKSNHQKFFYTPLAICIMSQVANTDAFKEILHEGYRIITYYHNIQVFTPEIPSSNFSLNYVPCLDNYKYCALLNYFVFLNNIVHPPNFSKMTLNFLNSSVEFKFSSKFELPASDSNIKILFDCLEISIIIKLWCAILTEKRIIIIANQSYLLYSICEALIKLIFPFKWLHPYIPILPSKQIEFLGTPTPCIMGVLSSSVDYQQLLETYPSHIICNVDTSEIYSECLVTLPRIEETKLRKKLQFVKNPDIFDIEDIIKNPANKTLIEDINPHRTFSENVQYIFFRIFRNALSDFDVNYLNNENYQFDPAKFLEDVSLQCEDYKVFWEKVIFTSAFENFIEFNNYLDESNTELFKNVVKSDTESIKCGYFNLNYNMTKNDMNKFLGDLKKLNLQQKGKERLDSNFDSLFIENFEKCISDYNFFYIKEFGMSNINLNNVNSNNKYNLSVNSNQVSSFNEKKHKNRNRNLSSDAGLFINKNFGVFNDNCHCSNRCNFISDETHKLSQIEGEINLKPQIRHEAKYYCMKLLSKKDQNSLNFYPKLLKEGFIGFIEKLNEFITKSNSDKLDITEIGIKNQIIKKLKEDIFLNNEKSQGINNHPFEFSPPSESSNNMNLFSTSGSFYNTGNSIFSTASNFNLASSSNLMKKRSLEFVDEILELDSENHSVADLGSDNNSRRSTINRNTTYVNTNNHLLLNNSSNNLLNNDQERFSISTNLNVMLNHELIEENITFDNNDSFQFSLLIAYLIEEIFLKNSNHNDKKSEKRLFSISKEERNLSISKLFESYEKAFILSKEEFPKTRYRVILSTYSTIEKLKECKLRITKKIEGNQVYFKEKINQTQINDDNLSKFIMLVIEAQFNKLKKEKDKEKNTKISFERERLIPKSTPITPKNFKSKFSMIKTSPIISSEISESEFENPKSRNHSKETKRSNMHENDPSSFSFINMDGHIGNTSMISYSANYNMTMNYSPCNKTSTFFKMMSLNIKDDIRKRKKNRGDSDSHKNSGSSSSRNQLNKPSSMDSANEFKIDIKNMSESNKSKNPFKLAETKSRSNEEIDVKPCLMNNFSIIKSSKCQEAKSKICDKNSYFKNMILNNFIKILKSDRDPLSLAEDISFKLFALVDKFSLNKFGCDMLTRKSLQEVASSEMFTNIKETICELQKVNITKILTSQGKICFWLNLFNFLTLFTVILKNEILNTQYEWTKFLKNSYFNIGGWEISLFEIQNCILTNKYSKFMYGEDSGFSPTDVRKKFIIDLEENKNNYLLLFGIYLPTK